MRKAICLLLLTISVIVTKSFAQTIINKYAAVLAYSPQPCSNILIVDSTTGFNVGDTILMIQMKGAAIDSSNTVNFGNVLNYNSCGNYEYNVIKTINGNNIDLIYDIVKTYDIPAGKVQLVKVPSYQNYNVNQLHTCAPWNGSKGGVFAINVQNTLTLNANIDVTGKGFLGGKSDPNPILRSSACVSTPISYCMPLDYNTANSKGEGIAEVSAAKSFGIGKLANGGGSGFSQNSGGGGGGNGNIGGKGGSEYVGCNSNPANNIKGGIGGLQLGYSNLSNKVFLGGGGGSGHVNNINISNGGNGGGICIIGAQSIIGNAQSIIANGQDGLQCVYNASVFGSCHDGMGGGGGAGTILLNNNNYTGNLNVVTKGGRGADENGWSGYYEVGPGGGGGGGVVWFKNPTIPAGITSTVTGGANGVVAYNNSAWGAQPGQSGQVLTNLNLLFPTDSFISGNVVADFTPLRTNCFTFQFTNQSAFPVGSNITYSWNFGDATTSSLQNPVHTYSDYGAYSITLTTTANGCSSSITKTVNIPYFHFADVSNDTMTCGNTTIQLNATGGQTYSWIPSAGLNNASLPDPVANVTSSITYLVNVTDSFGCTDMDSVKIVLDKVIMILTPQDAKLCGGGSLQLSVAGIVNPQWSPASGLDNPLSYNPVASPAQTTTYIVTGISALGCEGVDSVTISIYPAAVVSAFTNKDTINCTDPYVHLSASGAATYYWTPFTILDNPTSANPVARLKETTSFTVIGTDINGCKDSDTLTVAYGENKVYFIPNSFSPNGDDLNEEFLPKYFCNFLIRSFQIYNRFGQRVFSTTDPNKGWNGKQNDKDAEIGTYFWYIEGKTITNQTIIRKGDVTLIR